MAHKWAKRSAVGRGYGKKAPNPSRRNPALLAQGNWYEILEVTLTAAIGLIAIAAFFENFLFFSVKVIERYVLLAAGILLILPVPIYATAAGASLFCVVLFTQWQRSRAILATSAEEGGLLSRPHGDQPRAP